MIVLNTSAIQSPVEELEPQGVNRNLRQILVRWCLLVGPWQTEGSPVFSKSLAVHKGPTQNGRSRYERGQQRSSKSQLHPRAVTTLGQAFITQIRTLPVRLQFSCASCGKRYLGAIHNDLSAKGL